MRKSNLFILLILFFSVSLAWGQIISQYIETNSGVAPKGIEIWNNTESTLDFSANSLVIEKGVNGAVPSADFTLSSGTLISGAVIVIGTSNMQTITELNGSTFHEKTFTFNGDDALQVKYGDVLIDVFGEPGIDPGSSWSGNGVSTANQNIQLKTGITDGDTLGWTDPSIRFETVSTDPVNDMTGFGLAPATGGSPVISNIIQTPAGDITSSTTVSVSADVTDLDGSITNAELHWGTTSGDLSTIINMSNTSGDTYTTDTDIPAQSVGTEVFYEIEATDEDSFTTTSSENSYIVIAPVTTTLPYSEDFAADLGNCYTYNDSGATKEWVWNSGYANMNGYNSGDTEIDWLILPGINLDNYTGEGFVFETSYNYGTDDENNYLKLYYSNDYFGIGDPNGATWTELAFEHPSSNSTWTSSGIIDLSSISGTSIWLAFKYHYQSTSYRNWDIDNISVQEAIGPDIVNVVNTPSNPGTSETVSVTADVTDPDGVSSVELHWGITSGSLGSTINMSNTSGDAYTIDTDIPAQSEGTEVFYEIYAEDNNTNGNTTSEYSYLVTDAVDPVAGDLRITEIVGDNADASNNDNGFAEILNVSGSPLLLDNVQVRYFNSNPGGPTYTIPLSGLLNADEYIIITQDETAFNALYAPVTADYSHGSFYFNGGEDGLDIFLTTTRAEVLDEFNENGVSGSPFTWNDANVYERTSLSTGSLLTSWTEITSGTGTPRGVNDNPLPVTLSSFTTAVIGNEFVQISWTTQSEASVSSWQLYKQEENSSEQIMIYSHYGTNTTEPYTYTFADHEVVANVAYYYYLEAIEYDLSTTMWGPISAILGESNTPQTPVLTMLDHNYPNPFNPSTTIQFDIRENEVGTLTIFNSRGQILDKKNFEAGSHLFEWDGTHLGSGIYFYRLETESYTKTRKMIMMK
ncbi:MAG: T9SS type A sorting domain-containing protein [Candidatus Cloacimonetes bacterium]|nr:T9SS type A sorting domain-containing protein [Candidatus Cloacimonadota bacterium]